MLGLHLYVVALAVVVLLLIWKARKNKHDKAIVPFGTYNVFSTIQGMTSPEPHRYLLRLAQQCRKKTFRLPLPVLEIQKFGSISLFTPTLKRIFVVSDVSLARQILQDPVSDKPIEVFRSFEGITNNTPVLFTSTNSDYTKSIRKMAHMVFSLNEKKSKERSMEDIAERWMRPWLYQRLYRISQSSDKTLNPVEESLAVSFFIICEAAFGCPTASYDDFRSFTHHLDIALQEFAYRQSTNIFRKLCSSFLPSFWNAKHSARLVLDFAYHMIDDYDKRGNSVRKTAGSAPMTFMDLLLQNPYLKERENLASEILMFLATGHETTGAMISNVMIQLAKHQVVQNKLRHELQKSVQSGRSLEDTTYWKYVLQEANRLFPVAAMGSTRVTGRDIFLDDGKTMIPKNSICLMPQYLCCLDRDVFYNSDSFLPERWEKASQEMKDATSLSFSLGPRSCPGQRLALLEAHRILPRLILEYSLQLESEGKPEYCVIMKHSKHTRLRIKHIGGGLLERKNIELSIPEHSSYVWKVNSKERSKAFFSAVFFRALIFLVCSLMLRVGLGLATTSSPESCSGDPAMKIAVLTEPSPIGSYICGQSKRIEYLMQYLVEDSNDTVELITTEVHDKIRPSLWKDNVSVQYTHGIPLPGYNRISISFDWTLKALRELIRFRPDLIHVTTPGPLLFPCIFASRLIGIPLVMSCHTHLTAYAETYLPPVLDVVIEWFLWRYTVLVHSFADITLVTSPQIQEDFEQHGAKRVHLWQKGVNSTQFHPDYYDEEMRFKMTGGNPKEFLIVYIGRLADEKRIDLLRDVLKRIPDARLCLVGAGPQEAYLRKYFEETKTIFLGQISDKVELSQAFASADVFCMPSTSETLGFVVLESMASKVPVVAADAGGLKYVIDNKRTGFLVTPDDAEAFAVKILELRSNPDLRQQMVTAAREEVEKLTWQNSMAQVRFQFYEYAKENFRERVEQRLLKRFRSYG